jgi:hypothetical protein
MSLAEITKEVETLPRLEKLQLIEAISKMLLEEENPAHYFAAETIYPVFTPDNQNKAAAPLQQLLNQVH